MTRRFFWFVSITLRVGETTGSANGVSIVHLNASGGVMHRGSSIMHRGNSIMHRGSSIMHKGNSIMHRGSSSKH